jgi:hypothetical protein
MDESKEVDFSKGVRGKYAKMIDIDEVERDLVEVQRIATEDKDHEKAHGLRDRTWEGVLRAIADGNCDDPKELAAVALKPVKFNAWCA